MSTIAILDRWWHSTGYWWFCGSDLTPAYLLRKMQFISIRCIKFAQARSLLLPRFKSGVTSTSTVSRWKPRHRWNFLRSSKRSHSRTSFVCHRLYRGVRLCLHADCRRRGYGLHRGEQVLAAYRSWALRGVHLTSDRGARFGLASGMVNHRVSSTACSAASWAYDDQPTLR